MTADSAVSHNSNNTVRSHLKFFETARDTITRKERDGKSMKASGGRAACAEIYCTGIAAAQETARGEVRLAAVAGPSCRRKTMKGSSKRKRMELTGRCVGTDLSIGRRQIQDLQTDEHRYRYDERKHFRL